MNIAMIFLYQPYRIELNVIYHYLNLYLATLYDSLTTKIGIYNLRYPNKNITFS